MRTLVAPFFASALAATLSGCNNAPSTHAPSQLAPPVSEAPKAHADATPTGGAANANGKAPTVTANAQPSSSESAGPRPPFNVLLISIDSMRADMPWAGYPRPIAPRLTELEKRATSYTRAYSISSFTSKSLGGFLGGRLPSELERTSSFFTRYLPQNVMFPEALAAQGVRTIGGHAHAFFGKGESGFEQGFDDWRVVPGITFDYNTDPFVTSQKLTPLAIEMLSDASLSEKRFFAWFHYMDPHERYQGHEESPHFGKKPRDVYDEEIFYTDAWIGKLLDFVETQPWAKRTAIIVTADHGEAFGEHGLTRHAFELYEVLVHVPLFIIVPGQPGRSIDAPRSHLDLVPTVFDLLGAKPNPELRGRSFAPELFGAPAESRDVVCDLPEDTFNERRRALVHENSKIIAFGNDTRYELYDLSADPGEKENLFKKAPERAREMVERYKAASAAIHEAPIKGGVPKHKG